LLAFDRKIGNSIEGDNRDYISRADIKDEEFRVLITLDGCGSELNSMRELCGYVSTYSDDDDDSRPETYDELDTDDNSNINDKDTSLYNTQLANTLPSYFYSC
jgi:hypothetical protein